MLKIDVVLVFRVLRESFVNINVQFIIFLILKHKTSSWKKVPSISFYEPFILENDTKTVNSLDSNDQVLTRTIIIIAHVVLASCLKVKLKLILPLKIIVTLLKHGTSLSVLLPIFKFKV